MQIVSEFMCLVTVRGLNAHMLPHATCKCILSECMYNNTTDDIIGIV